MSLRERLIFGTGQVYGGASIREAVDLLRAVRDGGIDRFDTAPLYGAGTAEKALGRAFANDPEVRITTKVGLKRPIAPVARSWARRLLRATRRAAGGTGKPLAGPPTAPPGRDATIEGCFDPLFMRESISESLAHLRRAPTLLLLHECHAVPLPETIDLLERAVSDGTAGATGYANGDTFDPALHARMPPRWIAQVAVPLDALRGREVTLPDAINVHSLLKSARWLDANDPAFGEARRAVTEHHGTRIAAASFTALLPYCLAASILPKAGLIFATTDRHRAKAFLQAVSDADRIGMPGDLARDFAARYRKLAGLSTTAHN